MKMADTRKNIEQALTKKYHNAFKVVIRSESDMSTLLQAIPKNWFSDTTRKYNVIFLRHAIDSKTILDNFATKPAIEAVTYVPGALLWSANTSDLTRSTMIKLSKHVLYQDMTVRNLNTTRKIAQLMKLLSNTYIYAST